MKTISFLTCLLLAWLSASLAWAQGEPTGGLAPASELASVIDAVRSGGVIAVAAAAITLLVDLLKAPWLGGVVTRVPRRWRVAFPVILGGVAGMLSDIVGGLPWQEAMFVGLFSGPTAVFAHEAVVEAILGRSRTRDPEIIH